MFKLSQSIINLNLLQKYGFSSIFKAQYNPVKNAVRFENQNRTWSFEELEEHTNAFAYGLVEQQYKQGDKLLLLLDRSNTSEIVTAQIGAAKAGVIIVPLQISSEWDLEKEILSTKCKGILFSPNSKIGEQKQHEVVSSCIKELDDLPRGAEFTSKKFSDLKYIVHTGFYSYPGTYKFRETMVYASKNFNSLNLPTVDANSALFQVADKSITLQQCIDKLNKRKNINNNVIVGDPKSQVAFTLGVLNTIVNGHYSVYTGNQDLNNVGKTVGYLTNSNLVVDQDVIQGINTLGWSEQNLKQVSQVIINDKGTQGGDYSKIFQGKNIEHTQSL